MALLCSSISAQIEFPKPAPKPVAPPQKEVVDQSAQDPAVKSAPDYPSHWEGQTGRVVRVWQQIELLEQISHDVITEYLDQMRGFGIARPRELALQALNSPHEASVELAVRLLEYVGNKDDSMTLVDSAAAVGSVRIAGLALDVAMRLNNGQLPEGTTRLLSHPKKGVRAAIERRLIEAPAQHQVENLLRLVEFGRDADLRLRAVRILEQFSSQEEVVTTLLKALDDISIPVAFKSAEIICAEKSTANNSSLTELVLNTAAIKGRAYIIFELLRQQNESKELLIDEQLLPLLEESFNSADTFLAGVSAACMGEYMFRAVRFDGFEIADKNLLHTLVSAVAGTAFYPQFSRFSPLGEATLSRITGEDLSHLERRAWLAWEIENIEGFVAVRGNLFVNESELPQLSISWQFGDGTQLSLAGIGVSYSDSDQLQNSRLLGTIQLKALHHHLNELGLLDTRVLPGTFGESIDEVQARLEIKVGNKRKPMVFRGDSGFAWLPELQQELERIYSHNYWQSLSPRDAAREFVIERLGSWDSADDIGRMQFELALTRERLPQLSDEQVGAWCDHLLNNSANSKLWSAQLAQAFFEQLGSRAQNQDIARKLLDCALRQPIASLAPSMIGTLSELSEPLRSELMLSGMRRFEPAVASASLSDERLPVRVAAARALGSSGMAGRDALLRASKDRNPLVVRMAVRSLGELGDPTVVEEILPFAKEGVLKSLREEAIIALGLLGDSKAFSVIHEAALNAVDGKLQLAAIRALANLGDAESQAALVALFPRIVIRPLAFDYLKIIEAQGYMLSLATYRAYLDSADARIARVAAINLGRLGDGVAADMLMDFLPDTPHNANLLQALASATGADFRDMPDPAGVYAAWWRENGMDNSTTWLERAARNYNLQLETGFARADKTDLGVAVSQLIALLEQCPKHLRATCVWHLVELTSVDCEVVDANSNITQVLVAAEKFKQWSSSNGG